MMKKIKKKKEENILRITGLTSFIQMIEYEKLH